jgi:hypothetical protein
VSAATSSAQSPDDARATAVLAGGIMHLPDALGTQCGTGGANAGWSTRGDGKRFFAEMERAQTRLHANERHNLATPSFTQPIVLHPVVYTVRAGIEIPFRSTR